MLGARQINRYTILHINKTYGSYYSYKCCMLKSINKFKRGLDKTRKKDL